MKATGIVRRIDDLGRVVIPKEIRRTMRIREGDPLEIFTSNEGEVVFKKYSPIGEINRFAGDYADVLHRTGGAPVLICDKDHVVAVSGIPKKEVLERRVSPILEDAMKMRRVIDCADSTADRIKPVEGLDRFALICYPIIAASDVCGALMFVSDEQCDTCDEVKRRLAESAAGMLAKQMEG